MDRILKYTFCWRLFFIIGHYNTLKKFLRSVGNNDIVFVNAIHVERTIENQVQFTFIQLSNLLDVYETIAFNNFIFQCYC